jgi:membrane protein DedA with SNARE-associated domain
MTTFLQNEGYLALAILAFVQACCIPISSEIVLGFAGVQAYDHHLTLALVIVVGVLAEYAGSFTAYGLGRLGGRSAVERYRKYVLMTRKDVERVERFFDGRGAWAVALARIIPLVRAFAGLVAGLLEVPVRPFAIFNFIGTAVWVSAITLFGYAVGSDWDKASKNFSHATDLLSILVVLLLVVLIVHKWHQIRKERKADAASAADTPATAGPAAGGPANGAPVSGPVTPGAVTPGATSTGASGASAPGGGRHRAPTDSQGG